MEQKKEIPPVSIELMKQIVFECAAELLHKSEGLTDEQIASKLLDIVNRMDKEQISLNKEDVRCLHGAFNELCIYVRTETKQSCDKCPKHDLCFSPEGNAFRASLNRIKQKIKE